MKQKSEFNDCLAADQRRLRGMARDLRHLFGAKRDALQAEYTVLLEKSQATVAARRAALPRPSFPDELPINERRHEIAALLKKHQVVIVCVKPARAKPRSCPNSALSWDAAPLA